MTDGPRSQMLPDRARLHLSHGPIDLIIGADVASRARVFAAAEARFQTLLTDLAAELPALRSDMRARWTFRDPVALRMRRAVLPFADEFVTPMAAVAGSVADDMCAAILSDVRPQKLFVNNGGDVALFLADGEHLTLASPAGPIHIPAESAVRGVATSGWRGRSHSFGIADAVTVLGATAAAADIAATLIANQIDCPAHPSVERSKASDLQPDSDLGDRLVTTHVGQLGDLDISRALSKGIRYAELLCERGLIHSATMLLQGQSRVVTTSKTEMRRCSHG